MPKILTFHYYELNTTFFLSLTNWILDMFCIHEKAAKFFQLYSETNPSMCTLSSLTILYLLNICS